MNIFRANFKHANQLGIEFLVGRFDSFGSSAVAAAVPSSYSASPDVISISPLLNFYIESLPLFRESSFGVVKIFKNEVIKIILSRAYL